MDLLQAVNRILPKLGEHPVTSLSLRHSTVALILKGIDEQLDLATQRGWWFNEFVTTLLLNGDSEIALPVNTMAFVPTQDNASSPVQRGGKLFNPDTLTFKWDAPQKGVIRIRLPFEELPESAAQYVWYSALCTVYVTDIGLASDFQVWSGLAAEAKTQMEAEHLEQKRYSTARSVRYARVDRARRG